MTERSKSKKMGAALLTLLLLCISLGFWGAQQYQSSNQLESSLTETNSKLERSQKELVNLMLTLDSSSKEYAKLKEEYLALEKRAAEIQKANDDGFREETPPSIATIPSENKNVRTSTTGGNSSNTTESVNEGETTILSAEDAIGVIEEGTKLTPKSGARLILNGVEIKKGESVNLDLQFANSSDRLTETSQLLELAKQLKSHPQVIIKLSAQTEPNPPKESAVYQETASMHLELSKRRVESVASFLVEKGVPQNQIETSYFGGSQPKYSKDPRKNRRVELEIVKE